MPDEYVPMFADAAPFLVARRPKYRSTVIVAVRLGLFLSALAVVVALLWSAWALVVGPEWWLVILISMLFFLVVAFAVIWLGVFVAIVVRKAVRVLGDTR